ncbi:MAG: NAD-dependent epimerase/dehydratase family protein [Longimicrobiales bacterium]
MTVLVTGANGFVGNHLVGRLHADGVSVRALVRKHSNAGPLDALGVDHATADLDDNRSLGLAVAGCDVVYHLAAAHGPTATADACESVNVRGTARLAQAAAHAGVSRFVYASTRGVHGIVRGGTIDERTPTAPDTFYRASKLRGEQELTRVAAATGMDFVIVRLPSMIGPGAISWLGLVRAVSTGRFRMIGTGTNRQHPCPIDDAVQALALVRTADSASGETFVVGGAETVSTREFLICIADTIGVALLRGHIPAAPYVALRMVQAAAARSRGQLPPPARNEFFLMNYRIDDTKARRALGYEPAHALTDAVREMLAWYRMNGHL